MSVLILAVIGGSLIFGLSHYYLLNGAPTASLFLDSRSATAYAHRAKQRMSVDPIAAARDLQKAREMNPLEPNYDLWYIECYRLSAYRGRAAELIPAYERMLTKEPASAVLHYLAASRLIEINTPQDAAVEKWAFDHLGHPRGWTPMGNPRECWTSYGAGQGTCAAWTPLPSRLVLTRASI
ncbi:MAG: hypothetical protein IPJ01_12810 [Micavibrio sp.]|nr:hypothetical protein [Micavibrio sp.]